MEWPSGGVAVSGDPISSTAYNTFRADLLSDLNAARPVVAGGTGATTAADARTNLGAMASDALLVAIAALTTAADRFLKFTGVDTVSVFDLFGTANAWTGIQTFGATGSTAVFGSVGANADNFVTFRNDAQSYTIGVNGAAGDELYVYIVGLGLRALTLDPATGIFDFARNPTIQLTPTSGLAVNSAGFRGTPPETHDADYTFVLGDSGKTMYHTSGSTHTYTIPANASVAYPVGTIIQIENENGGGNLTLAITSDTLRWGSSTGSRTIAANGSASIKKMTSTSWRLLGTGIS